MGGYWRLNGVDLVNANVSIVFNKLTTQQRARQSKVDLHRNGQFREFLGLDLPTGTLTIQFNKRGTPKYDQMAAIQTILETDEVWTLEAPSDRAVFVYKNYKRAAFSFDSWSHDSKQATGTIGLACDFTINGVWAADGGSYCELLTGNFTLLANGTYLRDDGVNTGTTPKLRLPAQFSGYPLGVNSAYQQSQIPISGGTVTVGGLPYEDYTMTGFLWPAPAATGDVGVYEVCQCPSTPFMSGPTPTTPTPSLTGSVIITGPSLAIGEEGLKDNAHPAFTEEPTKSEALNITNT